MPNKHFLKVYKVDFTSENFKAQFFRWLQKDVVNRIISLALVQCLHCPLPSEGVWIA